MGSSTAPKTFAPSTSFGASPQTPITTQTQPLALNSGTQTPAMSGYQMQSNAPITSPMVTPNMSGGGDGSPDAMPQLKVARPFGTGTRMPFYGAM